MWYPGRVDLLGSADDGGRGSSGGVPVCCAPHICGINQVDQIVCRPKHVVISYQ